MCCPRRKLSRFEEEMEKLEKNLGGIKEMSRSSRRNLRRRSQEGAYLRTGSSCTGYPSDRYRDTNCDPEELDYVIPGNDDAIRAVKLIVSKMADAVVEAKQGEENVTEEEVAADAAGPI